MAVTVRDVVEIAQAKGCVLAAGKSRLDRVVRYVDGMEIPNMEAWMRPNVLYITTGYAYSGTKERLLSLIRSLNKAEAAALAIKSRFIEKYLEDVLKLAEEYQFPIIIMPEELPFVELNYAVMEALVTSQHNDALKSQCESYNKRKEHKKLFIDLLAGNITYEEERTRRITKQNWPASPYYVMLLEVEGLSDRLKGFSDKASDEEYEKMEQLICEALSQEHWESVVLSNNNLFPCILKKDIQDLDQEYFEKIQEYISKKTGCSVLIGVSAAGEDYHKFHDVYQGAMDALEIARSQEVKQKVVCIEKAAYWKLLKEISHQPICKEYVSKELDALIQYDKGNESNLLETLETLVDHLGARNTTATCLYLHRNTLMYRIKKIEHLTGYDLSDPESILELSVALRLRKFMQ